MKSSTNDFGEFIEPIPEEKAAFEPWTVRRPFEILSMEFSDEDFLLEGGYLAKGDPFAICGAPGVGKSRLFIQLVIALLTGRQFLGWETNGKGTNWLILQTENGNRRLKHELSAMFSDLTETEKEAVNDGMIIHTLETAGDSFASLKLIENEIKIAALIKEYNPTGVGFDVLRDYGIGDLNGDEGMTSTLSTIGRITREGDPQRIPVILHHALTGKTGAARATGFERGSFGRNSKVLLGWVRSQINVAQCDSDNNETLIIASGKSNNSQEFEPFGIRLDLETMTYHRDDSIDIPEWKERVGAETSKTPHPTIAHVVKIVEGAGLHGIAKAKIIPALMLEVGCKKTAAYNALEKAENKKAVYRRKDDDLYVTR